MSPLFIFNPKEKEPKDYLDRKTAKAVVVNNDGLILTLGSMLIGGGVEDNETYEQALHREALEEAGITIEIQKYLGDVFIYRDVIKKKYIVKGYIAKFLEKIAEPTDDIDYKRLWELPHEAISRLTKEISEIEKEGPDPADPERFEARVGNRKMTKLFIEEAFKK